MKILKRKELKTKKIKHKCQKCGSVLVYDETDVMTDRDGRFVICPVCRSYITSKL